MGKWLSNPGSGQEAATTKTGVGKYLSVPSAKPAASKAAAAAVGAAAAGDEDAPAAAVKQVKKAPAGQSGFGNFDAW